MLDTATAFFLAGERCAPPLSFGKYKEHTVSAPCIVCYALAAEIGMKLLLILSDIPVPTGKNGHQLRGLYEALPCYAKDELRWIEDHLDEMNDSFVDWRYPYERDFLAASADEIRRAFILVYRQIRNIRPSLLSVYEENWGQFDPDWQLAWHEIEASPTMDTAP